MDGSIEIKSKPAAAPSRAVPPPELTRSHDVQQVLRGDLVAPPATLLEASDYDLGTAPLDVARYLSQEFYDLEVKKLWPKVWQCAVWGEDIPNPGDTTVYAIAGKSLIMARQKDGSVKAFGNSCLHRGRQLCTGTAHRSQLRCPYHGYTWSLEGDLRWMPSQWDFPQVDPEKFALPQVRVEEWNGFYFVNFDADAPSLKDYMGAMQQQWTQWDYSKKYKAVHVEKLINCNWKVCQDGFIETMHLFSSHPQMASMTPCTSAQYDIYPNEPHFSRFHAISGFPYSAAHREPTDQEVFDSFIGSYVPHARGTDDGTMRDGETARQAFARVARKMSQEAFGIETGDIPESELIDATEYTIFPNFSPWASIANPIVYRFRPGDGPDWCIWETMLFYPYAGERPPSGPVIRLGPDDSLADVPELGGLGLILQQDAEQLPLVQTGLKASLTGELTLTRYQESRIRHYMQTLDQYLAR